MDWTKILTEILKAAPEVATVLAMIFMFLYYSKQQKENENDYLESFARQFADRQDSIEKEFRQFLMQQNQEFRQVIQDYTNVIKEFNKTQDKTNTVLLQNVETNRLLTQVLNEHLVAWNLKTLKEK